MAIHPAGEHYCLNVLNVLKLNFMATHLIVQSKPHVNLTVALEEKSGYKSVGPTSIVIPIAISLAWLKTKY